MTFATLFAPRTLYALLVAGSLTGTSAATAAPEGIAVSRLTDGQVTMDDVSQHGVAGKAFLAATIMPAPVDKICATLLDFAAYPRFMPNTESALVSQTTAAYTLVDMTLKLPMGKIKKYRLKMTADTGTQCRLAWKLAPWPGLKPDETIVDTSGAWQLVPLPGHPDKTVVQYAISTDPGAVPLGLGWIVDSLSKDSIPKMMAALRSRVTQTQR